MAILIKKFSKRAVFSVALASGIFFAFIVRLFFGAGHINLSRLNSGEKNSISSETPFAINSARADIPRGGVGGGGDGGGDGSGDSG